MTGVKIIEPRASATWELLESRRSEQAYVSRSWDYEVGDRLVIGDGERIVEASVFRHSLAGTPVKTVVELPTSFGCQVRCPHCASGDIGVTRPLSESDLAGVYEIAAANVVGEHLVSFAGIGECSLNERNVLAFTRTLSALRPVHFTMTTVGIRPEFVDSIDRHAVDVPVKLLQVSLFHFETDKVRSFMGRAFARYDFDALAARIRAVQQLHVRVNVVLMAGFNDTTDVWEGLAAALLGAKDRISVRVSKLNETNVSRQNGVAPTSRERVLEGAAWFAARGFEAYPFMSSYNDDMNCGQLVWDYSISKSEAA